MTKLVASFNNNRSPFLLLSFLFLGVVFLYIDTIHWLVNLWWTDRTSTHGFFVPLLSLYLIWLKKEQLRTLTPSQNYLAGSAVILVAAFMLVAGRAGGFIHAETISLIILLPGIVILLLGWNYLKVLGFSLFYLQFMIPWIQPIIDRIPMPFQLLTAKMASVLLQSIGFSNFQTGIFIELPGFTMEVAPECSGVTYLLSIIAIGLPLVYISQKTWKRGLMVILAGIATMFIVNWVRVTIAGLMGTYYGVDQLHGPGHILRGWVVAQIGWIALFVANWRVGKMPSPFSYTLISRWRENEPLPPKKFLVSNEFSMASSAMVIFLIGLTAYLNFFALPLPVALHRPLLTLPAQLGSWKGYDSDWIDGTRYFPGSDEQLIRTYRKPGGREINLYIAYFSVQSQGKSLINFHNKPLHEKARQIELPSETGRSVRVNTSVLGAEEIPRDIFFWYTLSAQKYTSRMEAKFKTITSALIQRKNSGAVILAATQPGSTGTETDRRELGSLLKTISAHMEQITP